MKLEEVQRRVAWLISVAKRLLEEGKINRLGFLEPRRQTTEGKNGT